MAEIRVELLVRPTDTVLRCVRSLAQPQFQRLLHGNDLRMVEDRYDRNSCTNSVSIAFVRRMCCVDDGSAECDLLI